MTWAIPTSYLVASQGAIPGCELLLARNRPPYCVPDVDGCVGTTLETWGIRLRIFAEAVAHRSKILAAAVNSLTSLPLLPGNTSNLSFEFGSTWQSTTPCTCSASFRF